MDKHELSRKLTDLHQKRVAFDEAKAALDAARAAWEAEHAPEIQRVAELKAAKEAADYALRNDAELHFADTSEKKPIPGIEVKEFERVDVSPIDAHSWCRNHMHALLIVDMNLYEAVFKAVGQKLPMPGKLVMVPKATISADLSKHITRVVPDEDGGL